MGDYSRDTFKLTNVMHQFASGESVTEPRHYVSVRVQQGVPVLDADLNELADVPMRSVELVLRDLIGDGVPGKGQGFLISPIEVDNDFAIEAGVLVVGGWQVFNPARIQYSLQPRFLDENGVPTGTDLTTPAGDRTDIVYLDVWEQETTAASGDFNDPRLVNANVGVETALRRERLWTVRVAENETEFNNLTLNETGHKYYPLAKLFRSNNARILPHMILDQRRLGLTLADGIKSPMYIKQGAEELGPVRFSSMLSELRDVLKIWQENVMFPVGGTGGGLSSFMVYQNVFNDVYYFTTASQVNSDTFNLDNKDGLTVMQNLVDAQKRMIAGLRTISSGDPDIYKLYESYLNGDAAKDIDGIQPGIDNDDLFSAVQGQEELNEFLGLSTGELPEGDVEVILVSVSPPSAINATTGFTITFRVRSDLLVPSTPEQFDLEPYSSDVRWAVLLNKTQVTLAPGATEDVELTVNPDDTLVNGDNAQINLIAKSHRRPSIKSVLPAVTYTIGQPPPGATFFYYSGDTPLTGGTLVIPRAQIEEQTYDVNFTLVNSTGGGSSDQYQTFSLSYELQWPTSPPAGVDPNNWLPNAPVNLTGQEVQSASLTVPISLFAPSLSGVAEDVSFTLHITATLTHQGGTPVVDGKSKTIDLPITVDIV